MLKKYHNLNLEIIPRFEAAATKFAKMVKFAKLAR